MSTTLQPDFSERAKANDAPVARLIGFEAKEFGDGRGHSHVVRGQKASGSYRLGFHDSRRLPASSRIGS